MFKNIYSTNIRTCLNFKLSKRKFISQNHKNQVHQQQQHHQLIYKKSSWKILISSVIGVGIGSGILYDGFNEFEYCGGAKRFLRSFKIAALISFDYQWNLYNVKEGTEEYDKIIKEINLRSANRILQGCLANGGLYIKIGQGISAINHMLPIEYTSTLKKLENECLPRKSDEVKELFIKDFGKKPDELFESFDYNPIAAASLAQVFKARTINGNDVAVKVQYIDLQKRFSGDFATILFLQSIIKLIHEKYQFDWILKQVKGNLEQELNFVNEGKNSEHCAKDLAKFNYIYVPKVEWDLTNSRVLTAEWIDGYKISDLENIKNDKFDLADIDKKLFNAFSEQIFNTGFVHADPHPGNVFVRKNKYGKAELVLLDHGLYEHLPNTYRKSLCQFWEAIVLKDRIKMKKYAKELNVDDYTKLAEVLLQHPFNFKHGPIRARLTPKDIAYMQELGRKNFDSVINTLRQMPKNMLFIVRNLNIIRAIARTHGDPIDRPKHMARYAHKCLYKNEMHGFRQIKWIAKRLQFEFALFKISLQFWFVRIYLKIITKLGGSSNADVKQLFDYNIE